ncbi:DUF4446 family protein [Candidatus Microgenomates bacterium]|nr:DUF4446 family protein [Candidatus Microgenomates bacterium]
MLASNVNWWLPGLLAVWLAALTGWTVYRETQFRRFFGKAKNGDIRKLLEGLLTNLNKTSEEVVKLDEALIQIRKKDLKHIQKIGLVRFNPFRDAGGNQSFALCLLNEEESGVVITGLHARETTRIYVKDVVRGVGKTELSKEEAHVIQLAKR